MSVDRIKLFTIVNDPDYNKTEFLNTLTTATAPTLTTAGQLLNLALSASSQARTDINLLYGTTLSSAGAVTTSDITALNMVSSQSSYNQTVFLASLSRAANLLRALRLNTTQRTNFNTIYTATLQTSGTPNSSDLTDLYSVVNQINYSQTTFLNTLNTTPTPSPNGQLFSATSIWNSRLSSVNTVLPNSAALVASLVADTKIVSPFIATTSYSTPYYIVNSSTPKVPVYIVQNGVTLVNTTLNTETQKGVPIPAGVIAAAGRDGHLTVYDTSTDTLYEFWRFQVVNGRYEASWGGILYNASTSNGAMPVVTNRSGGKEYWGATATGLPAIGGTILLKELQAGVIPHALAFAMINPKNTFVSPATRSDGPSTALNAVPEGTRFRLPANVYIDPNWAPIIKMMVVAVRDYGMVLRDKSGSVNFYAEDTTPTHGTTNPYTPYLTNGAVWSTIGQFPWSQLIAVA